MVRKKIYRTNRGQQIDMEAMRIANEKTIAAGNMSVNAKGDIVQNGKIVKSAKDRVAPSYNKTTQVKQVSLKKPLSTKETKMDPVVDKPTPPAPMDDSQMTTATTKTRDDGSQYVETMTPTGDIEVKEVEVEEAPKPKPTRKKAKSTKKKPSV